MLAFVFWHWPREGVSPAEYEARLREFHQTLRRHRPPGFLSSVAYRGGPCAWGSATASTYEDWYLMEGTTSLDPLEHGAVTGPCKPPHDAVAALAAGGAAGLYRVRAGVPDLARARACVWFAKPAGVTYAELDALLAPLVEQPATSVWMRKMVLGPTPELCVLAPGPIGLPDRFEGVAQDFRTLEPVVG